ncbi:unnamed protein product [Closterium sp. Yama58-4]|nr:unnamed protein product [Closterium sp. Yama58-4]
MSSLPQGLLPSEDDLLYEEEILRNPFSLKLWWRYLAARRDSPARKRYLIYERALVALPGSYKLWAAYLKERRAAVRGLPANHAAHAALNNAFERALVTMHRMPRIWLEYLSALVDDQKLVTRARRTFDRALRSLPATQHDRLWHPYLRFVRQPGIPVETARRVFRRFLRFDPLRVEEYVEFLVEAQEWREAAERLASALNDEKFVSQQQQQEDALRANAAASKQKKQQKKKPLDWMFRTADADLRLARLEALMDRRPELVSAVLLRQNPHNVHEWHKRAKLFQNNPERQILTYTEAVKTVDPFQAVGKPHTLWVAFAKLYEKHGDLGNARRVLERAVQARLKAVEDVAAVWCEWAEMEVRHHNFHGARELLRRATLQPSVAVLRQAAAEGDERPQLKVYRSLKVWTLYVDLEESLGTLETTRAVYDRIIDLKIATPQIIINYALMLEEHKYFEDSFKVYERGVNIFKYPHVRDIWTTYLSKFVQRYGGKKLERARDLFEQALESAPATDCKPLYLAYAKLEEEYGLARHAMAVYERAAQAVPEEQRMGVYELFIARAAELFGVAKTRDIYERAIESGLPDADVKRMCLRYAALERRLGEIDRARAIFVHASQLADPRSDGEFWEAWNAFEIAHGNEDTFRDMLRIKRSVSASYSQMHFILPEYLMKSIPSVPREADTGRGREGAPGEGLLDAPGAAGAAGGGMDSMEALEQAAAGKAAGGVGGAGEGAAKPRVPMFVSGGTVQEQETGAGVKSQQANPEEIELADEEEEEEEEEGEGEGGEGKGRSKVGVTQVSVPAGVFGALAGKAEEMAKREREAAEKGGEQEGKEAVLGALERFKRQRKQ